MKCGSLPERALVVVESTSNDDLNLPLSLERTFSLICVRFETPFTLSIVISVLTISIYCNFC